MLEAQGGGSAKLTIPGPLVEQGLRLGSLRFAWKDLTAWIQPPVPQLTEALPAESELDLPLPVLAPLFMAQYRPQRTQKKVAIADTIPDLFKGKLTVPVPANRVSPSTVSTPSPAASTPSAAPSLAAAAPAAPATRPETPPPTKPAGPSTVAAPKPALPRAPTHIGELLGQPAQTSWTPDELVRGLASLPAIRGAVIAAQDGMLIASQVPPELEGQTIAAFLVQLYGRAHQYATEMKLNPTSTLTFESGEVTLTIILAGKVYLALVGRAGQALPKHVVPLAAQALTT
jgi:predicted regulator of Ras-like GTPase activity (Roadblock/LC7/MglB family)